MSFGNKNLLTALPLGPHLLFQCVADGIGWNNVLDLYAVYLYAPWVGGLVQYAPHLVVYYIAAGKGLVQFKFSDYVTQCGGRKVLQRIYRLLHAIGVQLRIRDLEINNCINFHGDVILSDDWLRREVQNLLLKGDRGQTAVDEWNLYMDSNVPGLEISAKPLNDNCIGLLYNADIG